MRHEKKGSEKRKRGMRDGVVETKRGTREVRQENKRNNNEDYRRGSTGRGSRSKGKGKRARKGVKNETLMGRQKKTDREGNGKAIRNGDEDRKAEKEQQI